MATKSLPGVSVAGGAALVFHLARPRDNSGARLAHRLGELAGDATQPARVERADG